MGIAEDMGRLAEDIITSYDVRVKALGDLVADTRKTVKGFTADRKKMASELAEGLAKFARDLSKSADDMLKGFRKSHKEMSDEQAKALADFVTDLTKNVGNMIKGLQKEHKEMASALKADLEKGETDRLKAFKSMMTGIQEGIKEIDTYVKKRLREFDEAHTEMSDILKKSLSRYVGDIVSSVKKLLGEYSSESAKAKRTWQGMSSVMAKARETGVVPRIEVGRKVTPIKKAKPKKKTKEDQILAIVRENPDGITLPEIAYTMGVPFVSLAKAIKNLQKAKKVRKREKLYFPK